MDQARNMYLSGGGRNPLRIDLPPDLPRVLADRQRIVQVLGNLLSNAARHSPESSAIRVAAVRGGRPCGGLGRRRRSRHPGGASAAPVPEVRPERPGGPWTGGRGGPGPGHMQGPGGGAWGPHLGRERGNGPGRPLHLHDSGRRGSRGRRRRRGEPRAEARPPGARRGRGAARPGGGRRPEGTGLRSGNTRGRGLLPVRDRRPGGRARPHRDVPARPCAAGPAPARDGRHRADAKPACAGRSAGHLPVRIRPRRNDRQGPRDRSGRFTS